MGVMSHFPADAYSGIPKYTYTGAHALLSDGDGNWRIRLLTSGTLTFTDRDWTVDAFLVGGGGGGGYIGGAGGGGYTKLQAGVVCQKNSAYPMIIGAGGAGGEWPSTGGSTTGFGYYANGGAHGISAAQQGDGTQRRGGNGGSGGGGYHAGVGGADGANGSGSEAPGGTGQGTTTREFHESGKTLYAIGGNGQSASPAAGNPNTGDGGGAGFGGGSGIAVIRRHMTA